MHHVGSFVDWWTGMNMSLANLEEILPQVRVDGTSLFRTETVTNRWKVVLHKYVLYQRKISDVEDYYKNLSGNFDPCLSFEDTERSSDDEATPKPTEQKCPKDETRQFHMDKKRESDQTYAHDRVVETSGVGSACREMSGESRGLLSGGIQD